MHEIAVMQGTISTIVGTMRQAGGDRITSVHLSLGASSHMSEESARQHFDMLAAGTPAENAELIIMWLPATYQCFSCGQRFEVIEVTETVSCPHCDSVALEVDHQDLCYASEIKIEVCNPPTGNCRPSQ